MNDDMLVKVGKVLLGIILAPFTLIAIIFLAASVTTVITHIIIFVLPLVIGAYFWEKIVELFRRKE